MWQPLNSIQHKYNKLRFCFVDVLWLCYSLNPVIQLYALDIHISPLFFNQKNHKNKPLFQLCSSEIYSLSNNKINFYQT